MPVANNADEWANPRQGIFFPASTNGTLTDGDLTGQCVSLTKWFLAEMTSVPNPGAARGNARYVGDNLVNQGYARPVSAGERKRGDLVVWKQGEAGHIAVLISGDRVFQENVNIAGTPSKVVYGQRVYASRIDPLKQSWHTVEPNFYRINTYVEKGSEVANTIPNQDNYYARYNKAMIYIRNRELGRDEFNKNFVGNTDLQMLEAMLDNPEADQAHADSQLGLVSRTDNWQGQIANLTGQVAANSVTIAELQRQVSDLQTSASQLAKDLDTANKKNAELQAKVDAYESGDTIIVTRKGFNGLFDVIRDFFKKGN